MRKPHCHNERTTTQTKRSKQPLTGIPSCPAALGEERDAPESPEHNGTGTREKESLWVCIAGKSNH